MQGLLSSTVVGTTIVQYHRTRRSESISMNSSSIYVEATIPSIYEGNTEIEVKSRVTLLNFDQNSGHYYYRDPPYGAIEHCYPNTLAPYILNISCPNEDYSFNTTCPGQGIGGLFNYTCRSTEEIPQCFIFSENTKQFEIAPNCVVREPFDPFNTTCTCSLPTSTSTGRRS